MFRIGAWPLAPGNQLTLHSVCYAGRWTRMSLWPWLRGPGGEQQVQQLLQRRGRLFVLNSAKQTGGVGMHHRASMLR